MPQWIRNLKAKIPELPPPPPRGPTADRDICAMTCACSGLVSFYCQYKLKTHGESNHEKELPTSDWVMGMSLGTVLIGDRHRRAWHTARATISRQMILFGKQKPGEPDSESLPGGSSVPS